MQTRLSTLADKEDPDPVDLEPVMEALRTIEDHTASIPGDLKDALSTLSKGFQASIKDEIGQMGKDIVAEVSDVIESQEITIPVSRSTKTSRKRDQTPEPEVPLHIM